MNGLISLGMMRAATGFARETAETLGTAAADLIQAGSAAAAGPAAPAGASFAEILEAQGLDQDRTIQGLRAKLTTAIESVLQRLNAATDPALTFVASDEGTLQLQGDHPRAAEIEASLREDVDVQSLTAQLSSLANGADRRLVLHNVVGG